MASVWKNGKPVSLPDFGSIGLVDSEKYATRFYEDYVSGLYVSGNNVYVSGGSEYTVAHARYWVNGNPVDLTGNLVYQNISPPIGKMAHLSFRKAPLKVPSPIRSSFNKRFFLKKFA